MAKKKYSTIVHLQPCSNSLGKAFFLIQHDCVPVYSQLNKTCFNKFVEDCRALTSTPLNYCPTYCILSRLLKVCAMRWRPLMNYGGFLDQYQTPSNPVSPWELAFVLVLGQYLNINLRSQTNRRNFKMYFIFTSAIW